jgi:hypothetical protein
MYKMVKLAKQDFLKPCYMSTFHHGMAHLVVVDGGYGLQM